MDKNRISPDLITQLKEGEVFVFGSNAQGLHFGGAARVAVNRFGALMGQGEGLQGQSYAIPTMEGLESTRAAVRRFIDYARNHPELTFLVTPIGCGIAGHTPSDIAPMFHSALPLANIWLPESFWEVLK